MPPDEFEDAQWLGKMCYAGKCFKQAQAEVESVLGERLAQDSLLLCPLITAVYG